MAAVTIRLFHNPGCSKSRAALALLRQRGIEPEVVEYLSVGLTAETVRELIEQLGLAREPHRLLRAKESAYGEAGLSPASSTAEIVAAIAARPILLERPIAVRAGRAVIGRPPERVVELLDGNGD